MNWKAWAPLAVAIVLGTVAAITARNLVNHRPAAAKGATGPEVVIVKQPLVPGQPIALQDVTTAPLAWKERPAGTFASAAEVIGRVAAMPLVPGQPVLESVLAAAGSGSGLQALVPEGMRAITMEVNEFSSLAGLVAPGCSVDVVATIEDARSQNRMARTIVQDVKVLAVGQRVSPETGQTTDPRGENVAAGDQPFKSVTLLTTPQEAEMLELASMVGRPRLVLRGSNDPASSRSDGVTVAQLTGTAGDEPVDLLLPGDAPVRTVAGPGPTTRRATPQHVVRVIKGGVESTVALDVEPGVQGAPELDPSASGDAVYTHTDQGQAFLR